MSSVADYKVMAEAMKTTPVATVNITTILQGGLTAFGNGQAGEFNAAKLPNFVSNQGVVAVMEDSVVENDEAGHGETREGEKDEDGKKDAEKGTNDKDTNENNSTVENNGADDKNIDKNGTDEPTTWNEMVFETFEWPEFLTTAGNDEPFAGNNIGGAEDHIHHSELGLSIPGTDNGGGTEQENNSHAGPSMAIAGSPGSFSPAHHPTAESGHNSPGQNSDQALVLFRMGPRADLTTIHGVRPNIYTPRCEFRSYRQYLEYCDST